MLQILSVIAPVLVIIAIGYVWARRGLPFDTATIGSLVLRVGTPALIFSSLTQADMALGDIGLMVLAATCVIAVSTVVGYAALRLMGQPSHTYLLSAMHGNTGNMGLPLVAMVFGPEGLALAVGYFAVVSMSQNTLGLIIFAGKFDGRAFLAQPVVPASALTVLVLVTGVPVPEWIGRTTELLGGLVIPTMLLLLGVSLAQLKVSDLPLAASMSVVRFVAGAAGAVAIILAFGLSGIDAGVVWLLAVMPASVLNVVFAERFGRSPEKVAGMIVVSTVATLICLPPIVWAAFWIGGTG